MENLQIIENNGIRVLATKQIAGMYETDEQIIVNNYNRNKSKYIAGKHYICLTGLAKAEFIKKNQNDFSSYRRAKAIYLWTEKGALLHAKSLNTDKAWEVYDYLVDHYFRAQEIVQQSKSTVQQRKENKKTVVDIPVNREVQEQMKSLRADMTAIDSVLVLINRYQPEADYEKLTYTLSQLCCSVAHQGFVLGRIKPKLIEKG